MRNNNISDEILITLCEKNGTHASTTIQISQILNMINNDNNEVYLLNEKTLQDPYNLVGKIKTIIYQLIPPTPTSTTSANNNNNSNNNNRAVIDNQNGEIFNYMYIIYFIFL